MDSFKTLENKLKAGVTLTGILSLGITSGSYWCASSSDAYAFAMTVLAFLFSLGILIALLIKKLPSTAMFIKIECVTCLAFVLLLVVGWIVFAINTFDIAPGFSAIAGTANTNTRIAALMFQLIDIIVFAWIAMIVYKKIKK